MRSSINQVHLFVHEDKAIGTVHHPRELTREIYQWHQRLDLLPDLEHKLARTLLYHVYREVWEHDMKLLTSGCGNCGATSPSPWEVLPNVTAMPLDSAPYGKIGRMAYGTMVLQASRITDSNIQRCIVACMRCHRVL